MGSMTVTLNRPEVLSAFNDQIQAEFFQLWGDVNTDDDVKVVVLAASGDRVFCTGVDVTERMASENAFIDRAHPWDETTDPGRYLSSRRNEIWKPSSPQYKVCAATSLPHGSLGPPRRSKAIAIVPGSDVARHVRSGCLTVVACGLNREWRMTGRFLRVLAASPVQVST